MTFDAEQLKSQIPYYLTAKPEQDELIRNLDALSRGATAGYYIRAAREPDADSMLQGDGWRGLQLYSFDSGERRPIQGVVLSNSCDISKDNKRVVPPKIVFAPIVKLSAIEARFNDRGLQQDAISNRISSIKNQSVTSIFYLPAGGPFQEDRVVLLDDIHSMPVSAHTAGEKLFTLSMAGFYLFAFKLSVHFCRLQENVDIRPNEAA